MARTTENPASSFLGLACFCFQLIIFFSKKKIQKNCRTLFFTFSQPSRPPIAPKLRENDNYNAHVVTGKKKHQIRNQGFEPRVFRFVVERVIHCATTACVILIIFTYVVRHRKNHKFVGVLTFGLLFFFFVSAKLPTPVNAEIFRRIIKGSSSITLRKILCCAGSSRVHSLFIIYV